MRWKLPALRALHSAHECEPRLRQRLLEQALKSRAHSELDRMLLSAWKGPVDDALGLLGNLPAGAPGSDEPRARRRGAPLPMFANPLRSRPQATLSPRQRSPSNLPPIDRASLSL